MKFFDIQLAKSLIFCGLLFLVGCGGADSGAPSDSTCIPLAGCSEPDIGNANTSDPNSSSNSITGLWSQDGFSGLSYMNITAAGVREGYVESSSGDNCYYKDDSRILKQISGTLYSQSYTYSSLNLIELKD